MLPMKNLKCIADYNKYTGWVEHTNQLLQPYEIARESLKQYEKLAFHLQLALLKCFLDFKKNGGQKHFLQFQRDVIAVLVFGRDNDNHFHIPREENVVRLTERHFVDQIPPTAGKRKQRRGEKRCRDCYKKNIKKKSCYYCPRKPGLCYYFSFKMYPTKFVYWADT